MSKPVMDRLTSQLYYLPAIIGRLGLSIANAQKAFNADYLENIKSLLTLIEETLGQAKDDDTKTRAAAMRSILESLAPSRYQFTETTLDFSADLSESMDAGLTAGIGFGAAAIVVNASLTIGYGYDYRAASRITTVLHAIPANPEMAKTLLERATEIRKDKLTLPDKNEVDKEIFKAAKEIYDALTETQAGDADGNPAGGGTT